MLIDYIKYTTHIINTIAELASIPSVFSNKWLKKLH